MELEQAAVIFISDEFLVDEFIVISFQMIALDNHDFGHLLADFHDGVQGRKRILEDHSDFGSADAVEFIFGNLGQIFPLVEDRARIDAGRFRQNAHDGFVGDGFSGARFANDAESFFFV